MAMANRFMAATAGLFVLGLCLVALSVLRGEGHAGIALFIPFFYGTGPLASLGVLCFFVGMVLLFLGIGRPAMAQAPEEVPAPREVPAANETDEKKVRGGAIIMIGPVPIVYGSDPATARRLMVLALLLMVLFIVALLALAVLW